MSDTPKFGLLRKILKAIGLSEESISDLIDWITDRLADEQQESSIDPPAPIFPYRLSNDFLSPTERSFYLVLKQVTGESFVICPKVRLIDVLYVNSSDPREKRVYTNKIDRKHVDFLLCSPNSLAPLAGIELDDKSHSRADRIKRDEFVNQAFAAAGLKLLHIRAASGYQAQELLSLLEDVLPVESRVGTGTPAEQTVKHRGSFHYSETKTDECKGAGDREVTTPVCPKCGSEMILRIAKSGKNQGREFWGCSNFPRCRAIVEHEKTALQVD